LGALKRLYLDSNLLIYLIERRDEARDRLVIRLANAEPVKLCVSELSRLECRIGPIKQNNKALLGQYDRFFRNPYLMIFGLDRAVVDKATELRVQTSLKTPDALHLAAALVGKCDEFWTSDEQLIQAAANRIRVVSIDAL
jgi:uncharacterized protein